MRARAGARRGKHYMSRLSDLPSKKFSLQKIFRFFFSDLTLKSREARGVAQNQWTSLCEVRSKNSDSDFISTVTLYESARTYFIKNSWWLRAFGALSPARFARWAPRPFPPNAILDFRGDKTFLNGIGGKSSFPTAQQVEPF